MTAELANANPVGVGPRIQNVANPQRNGHIGKVFELAKLLFRRDMERNFRI